MTLVSEHLIARPSPPSCALTLPPNRHLASISPATVDGERQRPPISGRRWRTLANFRAQRSLSSSPTPPLTMNTRDMLQRQSDLRRVTPFLLLISGACVDWSLASVANDGADGSIWRSYAHQEANLRQELSVRMLEMRRRRLLPSGELVRSFVISCLAFVSGSSYFGFSFRSLNHLPSPVSRLFLFILHFCPSFLAHASVLSSTTAREIVRPPFARTDPRQFNPLSLA